MPPVHAFARINLEQARKQAKDLIKAHRAGDPRTLDVIRWTHPRFKGHSVDVIARSRFALADAQLVIARTHHFESWRALLDYVDTIARKDPTVRRFEDAADALVSGNIETLRNTLAQHPALVSQRSTRASLYTAPLRVGQRGRGLPTDHAR